MRVSRKFVGLSFALTSLPACQTALPTQTISTPELGSEGSRGALPDPSGAPSSDRSAGNENSSTSARQETVLYGDERFFRATQNGVRAAPLDDASTEGERFNFRNAPIEAVLNEILAETFGLSYSVDPSVRGSISLRFEGIATPDQAVAALNTTLGLQGYEIVETPAGYLVGRKGQQQSGSARPVFLDTESPLPADATLAVLQVEYASVSEVTEIASAILPQNTIRFADDARGFIVLSGEPDEVSNAIELVKSLDVNWLGSVSTALIPVENASPGELASDLEPLLSQMGGLSVVPIDRLQTLMVISRRREGLDQAREWIRRLDINARPQVTKDILVYEARYVNAEDLVALTEATGGQPANYQSQAFSSPGGSGGLGFRGDPNVPQQPIAPTSYAGPGTSLYSNLSIRVDPGRNAIVARGATDELQSLSELLSLLDKPKRQVLIEATIVEVMLSDSNSFGIEWDVFEDEVSATFADNSSGTVSSLFPGFSLSYINTDVATVVNALATTSDVEIVSSPRLLVLNNESARLQIGDQVPVITQSAVSITDPGAPVVNSTSYRDTGVILTVTPKIRAGGMVEVEVSQEVSGVSETTSSSIDSPTITQRSVESVLAVPDGATAVLGGLMSSTRSTSETGIPIMKDIPLIGAAFKTSNETERRTELVVLIEPSVVQEQEVQDIPSRLREALLRVRAGFAS